jgi:predicted TPR repeat methyltransferase
MAEERTGTRSSSRSSSSGGGRGPGRPTNKERADTLAGTIRTGLTGFADLLERRDELTDEDTLAGVIRRDADRMAEWLAALAETYTGADRAIRWLFGAGSVLGFAGAFGPLLSLAFDKLRLSGLFDFTADDPDRDLTEAEAFAAAEEARAAAARVSV